MVTMYDLALAFFVLVTPLLLALNWFGIVDLSWWIFALPMLAYFLLLWRLALEIFGLDEDEY